MEARFRKLKPNISDSTIKTYVYNMKRLKRISPTLDYFAISNYIKTMKNITSARTLLTALIVYEGRDRFGNLYNELIEATNKIRYTQKLSDRERKNWTSSHDIKKGITRLKFEVKRLKLLKNPRKLKPFQYNILQRYVVLCFYSEHHWRGDLVSVVITSKPGQNFYNMTQGTFYLNKFKTREGFRKRGMLPLKITTSRWLGKLINKFLYVRSLQGFDHDHLLVNQKGKPMVRSTFYSYLMDLTEKYVGKRLGASQMRHIYVTEFLRTKPSLADKLKMMYTMMQLRLETFESYARNDA